MTITHNISSVAIALGLVQEHCMCRRFEETSSYYRVYYPAGMRLDGVQASKGNGNALALSRMLSAMEKHWVEAGVSA